MSMPCQNLGVPGGDRLSGQQGQDERKRNQDEQDQDEPQPDRQLCGRSVCVSGSASRRYSFFPNSPVGRTSRTRAMMSTVEARAIEGDMRNDLLHPGQVDAREDQLVAKGAGHADQQRADCRADEAAHAADHHGDECLQLEFRAKAEVDAEERALQRRRPPQPARSRSRRRA